MAMRLTPDEKVVYKQWFDQTGSWFHSVRWDSGGEFHERDPAIRMIVEECMMAQNAFTFFEEQVGEEVLLRCQMEVCWQFFPAHRTWQPAAGFSI